MNVKTTIASLTLAGVIGAGGIIEGTKDLEPVDIVLQNEIVAMRDAHTQVFDLGNGKRKAQVFTKPIHWQDTDGKWKSIDTSIRPRSFLTRLFAEHELEVNSGVYRATFDQNVYYNYRYYAGGDWIQYTVLFDTLNARIDIETTKTGVKETVWLLNSKAPTTLKWLIESNAELQLSEGIISAGDIRTKTVVAEDANDVPVPMTVTLETDTLTVSLDTSAGITWPVKLDPSTTFYDVDAKTGRVEGYNSNYQTARSNTGNAASYNELAVGQRPDGSVYRVYRSALTFNTASLEDDAVIDSAEVHVTVNANYSITDFYMVLVNATYYTPSNLTSSWFNDFDGWESGTGAYSLTDASNRKHSGSGGNGTSFTFILTAAGLGFVSTTGYTTLMMLSSRDESCTQPSNNEYIYWIDDDVDIEIWYSSAPPPPSGGASVLSKRISEGSPTRKVDDGAPARLLDGGALQ